MRSGGAIRLGALPGMLSPSDRPVALLPDGTPVPGSEFASGALKLAAVLAARKERRWALVCGDTLAFARGLLALARAGKTIVLPQNPLPASIAEAAPEGLLGDGSRIAGFSALSIEAGSSSTPVSPAPFDAARVTLELHTSGSTARPKRIVKTLAQLDAEVHTLEALWGTALASSVVLATVPHHHLYGLLFRVLWPLAAGRPFANRAVAVPTELAGQAGAAGGSVLVSSPAFLTRIADPEPLQRLAPKVLFSSGAPLPAACAQTLSRSLGQAPIEVYGSTETGGIAWRRQEKEAGSSWQPLPGVATRFADASTPARLEVRSPWTPGADWIATGDLASPVPGGGFQLAGRADGVYKLADKRVNLAELAARLEENACVAAARVIALEDDGRVRLGAVVVPSTGGKALLAEQGRGAFVDALVRGLAERHETSLLPRKWRIVAELPVNAMGKVEHALLVALFEQPQP